MPKQGDNIARKKDRVAEKSPAIIPPFADLDNEEDERYILMAEFVRNQLGPNPPRGSDGAPDMTSIMDKLASYSKQLLYSHEKEPPPHPSPVRK